MAYLLLLASILLGVLGQILMKWGLVSPKPLWHYSNPLLQLFSSWPVLLGISFYGLSSIFWILTLKRMDLSQAYPMVSIGYVLVLAAGSLLFQETIPPVRYWGMGFILLGVIFVARG